MTDDEATLTDASDADHPSPERLKQYAFGELPDDELIDCASHLEECPLCREFVSSVPGDPLVTFLRKALKDELDRESAVGPLRLHRGFELMEEIGRGGMAVVYKARQRDLGRIVAFKQIRPELVTTEGLSRFRGEASVMARIQHPNIVQIYDVGEQDGRPYLAVEYVSGGSLDRKIDGNPLPPRAASQLVATLARAVHVAHQQSIIHRDLKPSNILLALKGEPTANSSDKGFWEYVTPKIGDFGLSKHLDQGQNRTSTGEILGTPGYMSPEQARGDRDSEGSLCGSRRQLFAKS